ncbi:MAG: restriction endonuclease subunit S [Desulfobacteria bacterium]
MSVNKELPNGWAWAAIPEMIPSEGVFVDGDWVESKDQDPNGEVRLIQLADIGEGNFKNKSSRFLTLKRANALNCTFLLQNDILVARMPDPIGRACLFPLKNENSFVTAVDVAIIRLGEKSVIPKYLMYSINNLYIRREIESLQSGTTRKRISRSNFATIKFPLPPLPEQHRIVAKIEELFSSLDKGIESLKTAQQQLKVYRQAVLKWAFEGKLTNKNVVAGELPDGWKKVKLGEVVKTIDGDRGPNYPKKDEFLQKGYCLFLSTKNVREDRFVFNENIFISKEKDEILRGGKLQLNDVVVTTRGTLGNVALYDEKIPFKNVRINSGMLILRVLNNFLDQHYLMKFISSPLFGKQLSEKQSGTAQPQIPANVLREIELPIPSTIEEQNAIVAEIESRLSVCDKIEESIEHSLKQSEALRQSILKKAFEGKLVLQDPNDEPASVLLERIKAERERNKPEVRQPYKAEKTKKLKDTYTGKAMKETEQ